MFFFFFFWFTLADVSGLAVDDINRTAPVSTANIEINTGITWGRNHLNHTALDCEMATLGSEVERRQQELERTSKLDAERYDRLQQELTSMKDRENRYRLKEAHRYKYKYSCSGCRQEYLFNTRQTTLKCNAARCEKTTHCAGAEMDYNNDFD